MDLAKHIKPLNSEIEWPMWKRKIRDLLDYHEGALDVIEGKLKKPDPLLEGANEAEVRAHKEKSDLYRKANSYAKSTITSAVTDAVYQKIMDTETAYEAWEALKKNFEASSRDQLFKLCTDFFAFSWKFTEDVSTHVAKLRSLWNELNNGLKAKDEAALPELILVCKILHILPTNFETFKSSWMLLSKSEDKKFEELHSQLCMFERNFTKGGEKVEQEALVAKSNADNVTRKKFVYKGNCYYCKQPGHWIKRCKKWIADGRPPKNAVKKREEDKTVVTNVTLLSVCSEACTTELDEDNWWIDNGATKHVTNCLDYFVSFEIFKSPHSVKAVGQESLNAIGKGSIRVLSTIGNRSEEIILSDVWYVPKISKNLFSVLAAQDRNENSIFESTPTTCTLKINGQVRLVGSREVNGSLYKVAIKPLVPKQGADVNLVEEKSDLLQLYHERWGHQDKRHVKMKLKRDFNIEVKLNEEICEPCTYGKAHRLPFGTREKSSKPGELISTDVCGAFDESFQKKRYFVLFKDNYTKFRYCYFLAQKSEVSDALKDFLRHTKTLGYSVKEMLSDNGREFDNEEVRSILRANGITQRLTAPYTPEQNGISERDNRTIVEMARTLKYSNPEVIYPEGIWAELVNTAVYILNRTGKSSIDGVSPYELWLGKKPRTKHLRIIGSKCYAHIPSQKRRKMDKKAVKGHLIGYDGDERFRIWIKEDHKVILSRDVKFEEKLGCCIEQVKLPFQDVNNEDEKVQESDEETIKEDTSNKEENESETDTEMDDESHENYEEKQGVWLRDRSSLKKPNFLNEYVMAVENLINVNNVPETFEEALKQENSIDWKRAMDKEIGSLRENQTWELVDLPKDAKAIPCKWVFRLKTNADGSIDKYKARLVVKGFNQREGVDYSQTFSPVAKMTTIRSILSVAANKGMHIAQFDVSTAFLYGELEETIYMVQPRGYEDGTNKVCKLKKSLYGLKQAPRCWNKRFGNFLLGLGFEVSQADPCLYVKNQHGKQLLVVLYVDDGLVAATDQTDLKNFFEKLKAEFKVTTSEATYFLGLQIEQSKNGNIKIHQETYARSILKRFNFSECKAVSTPMLKISDVQQSGKEDNEKQKFPYREAVGALMYLMLGTRPDLAFSVSVLSRTLENPTAEDILRLKRVFRYVAGTINYGITYKSKIKGDSLECYSDADFGGCTKTGRSTSGVVINYAGGIISWLSQRQAMVATSTTEAEIVAAHEAVKEVIWLSRLFNQITKLNHIPMLHIDNAAAVKLAQNPEFHRRTKHIDIKYFSIREKLAERKLEVEQISTECQVADVMTKPLNKIRLQILCNQMGLL